MNTSAALICPGPNVCVWGYVVDLQSRWVESLPHQFAVMKHDVVSGARKDARVKILSHSGRKGSALSSFVAHELTSNTEHMLSRKRKMQEGVVKNTSCSLA